MLNEGQISEVHAYVSRSDTHNVCACHFDDALALLEDPDVRVWINFLAPDAQHLARVVAKVGFHELAVEDVFSPRSWPKVEEYQGHLFSVVPALNLVTRGEFLDAINLNAFLGRNYLITAHRAPLQAVTDVRQQMERGDAPLIRGPDFVFYRLLDAIIDEYLPASDAVSHSLDSLEGRIFDHFDPRVSADVFKLKREVAWLRRRIGPLRGIIHILTNRPHELIQSDTQTYLRDVHDHIFRISENLDAFHDILQSALDAYLTQISNRNNEVMKLLSIVATIILPLNLMTGLYGTNFDELPGRTGTYSFWIFCAAMVAVAAAGAVLIRLRKWL